MKAIRTILACIRVADNKYNLINHGDKIVLGLSGGKDSVSLLYALHLYQKFSHTDFTLQPVLLDLGFPGFNSEKMEKYCESLGYKLIVNDSQDVYKILKLNQGNDRHLPCSICSKMKKAAINKVANDLGFNKVAFAHHADDAIETLFMNEMYGGCIATFSPKMHLERANITFIRPFALVRENTIEKLIKEENLPISSSFCPADKITSREDIKIVLKDIYKRFPSSKDNFLTMLDNYSKEDTWGKEISYQINANGLSLKPITTPIDMSYLFKIRSEVFVKELNNDVNNEFIDDYDGANTFLINLNETPIGSIKYELTDKGYKIDKLCILKDYRKHQYGIDSLKYIVNKIKEDHNPCRIYLFINKEFDSIMTNIGFNKCNNINNINEYELIC